MRFVAEHLPNWESFPVNFVAKYLQIHRDHVMRLIELGEISPVLDLRAPNATRSYLRVPREALLDFLKTRELAIVQKQKIPKA